MIHIDNLRKTYSTTQGEIHALDGVSLEIGQGEFVLARGPSGCGKSTLLLALGGMLRPTSGVLRVDGVNLYDISIKERARFRAERVGFVFQMFHLVNYLDVMDNVLLAARNGGVDRNRVEAAALLQRLGLGERLTHKPGELSAGEKQRAAVARALVNRPAVVLADEPTGNLDPDNASEIFRHLAEYRKQGGTVIVVTHGHGGDEHATRVIQMAAGKIIG